MTRARAKRNAFERRVAAGMGAGILLAALATALTPFAASSSTDVARLSPTQDVAAPTGGVRRPRVVYAGYGEGAR